MSQTDSDPSSECLQFPMKALERHRSHFLLTRVSLRPRSTMIFGLCMQSLLGFVLSGAYTPLTRPENIAVSLTTCEEQRMGRRDGNLRLLLTTLPSIRNFFNYRDLLFCMECFYVSLNRRLSFFFRSLGCSNASAESSFFSCLRSLRRARTWKLSWSSSFEEYRTYCCECGRLDLRRRQRGERFSRRSS